MLKSQVDMNTIFDIKFAKYPLPDLSTLPPLTEEEIFDIMEQNHFNHNSRRKFGSAIVDLYNRKFGDELIYDLQELMFINDADHSIYYLENGRINKFRDMYPSRAKFEYKSNMYSTIEFLYGHLMIYSGIVDEVGSDIVIHRDGSCYINLYRFRAENQFPMKSESL